MAHGISDHKLWRENASTILAEIPKAESILNSVFAVFDFVERKNWEGACHAVSAITFILLKEQDINATLCLGEVKLSNMVFNHSWNEIDNEVYDVAICRPLDSRFAMPLVIRGHDIHAKAKTALIYGSNSGHEDDPPTAAIRKMRFTDFMDQFPYHAEGLRGITREVSRDIGIKLDIQKIRKKYLGTEWLLK